MGLKVINRLCSLFVVCYALVSCTSLNSDSNEVETKQAATAKINVQLGMDYLERNDIARAKQKLLLALQQDPTLPEACYSMGYFLEATGDKVQAKKYYLKAIALAPERGDTQNNYGTFLCRSGDPKGSIQHFLIAVKDPEYLDTASAYENAGLCALNIPSNWLASHYFGEAIKQDPNRPVSLIEMAKLSYKQGDYPAAKKWLEEFNAISSPTATSVWLSDRLMNKIPRQVSSKNNASTSARNLRWN